ncbi:MAG: C-GCAxxG-C-C family (seleno)protein [Eubacteriales bacterium]|nr:C-GCAxxG-C-C family (seleno)protein [Eubacteriales bacterium]
MLRDIAEKYYGQNYNCAETIIRAGNDYYELGLHDRDMKMMAAYGGGIQTGNTCGAILSAAAILSMKYVEAKAHESKEIKPVTVLMIRKINAKYGHVECKYIKPQSWKPECGCLVTISNVCDILEETIKEYDDLL